MSAQQPVPPSEPSVCPENDWESYLYSTDNGSVVSTFYTKANTTDEKAFPHCARIIIPIKQPNANGMPENEEAETIWAMEDELVSILDRESISCRLLGRLTHGGTRELVFLVADLEEFRPPVGFWLGEHSEYDLDVSEHDGWGFFWESVWPSPQSWMLIMDRRVIDSLVSSGSDASKPHSLEFVFRGSSDALGEMKSILQDRDYALIECNSEEGRLVMAVSLPLELSRIFDESLFHAEKTKTLGLEYDGWGASVVN